MAGDAVFKVAADVADFVQKMSVAERATKKVAKSAGDIGDKVSGSLIKVELLKRAFDAAGRSVTNVLDKAASASKSAGDRGITLATNLERLGLRPDRMNVVSDRVARGSAVTTADQGVSLVKGVLSSVKDRRGGLSAEEAERLILSGVGLGEFGYGEGFSELLEGVSSGTPIEDIIKGGQARAERIRVARTDPMSAAALGVRGRSAETQAQFTAEMNLRQAGSTLREERSEMEETAAANPGGVVSIVSGFSETAATALESFKRNRDLEAGFDATQVVNKAAEPRGTTLFNPSQQLGRAISDLTSSFRKMTNQPNFSPDTK